ncbi:plasmid mobilization protein [Thiohalorhabdus sp.]|uniref:plasmid mobilization protein n=1 Tax=Thiohalorhabdus sp. TaxID=3094134 RepID=UPI002FC334D7
MATKSEQLTVRVTPGEKEEIERKAEAAGRSVSRFLAESALEGEVNSRGEREELVEELRKLYREVRSIGGNLNQVARRLNQGRATGGEVVERASEAAEKASEAVSDKMQEVV